MTELPLLVVDVQRGGPVDRPAHQDRAGRPAAGALRPQRRVAGGGAGAAVTVRLLRDRDRGGAHRVVVPHPGDPVVRRRDRQRLGAVANPGRQLRCRRSTHTFAKPDEPFQPYARDPETLARQFAVPGHPRAGAPHRRPGSGQRLGRHLLRAGQPRPDGSVAPGQDRRHRGSRPRGRRPDRRRRAAADRVGQFLRPDRRSLPARAAQGHQGRACPPALPEPVPGEPGRRAAALPARWWHRR